MKMSRFVVPLLLAFGLSSTAFAQPSPNPPAATVAALKAGGTVIVMRHGATFPDQFESEVYDLKKCSKQRLLNISGKAAASAAGVYFNVLGVKITTVTTSFLCRAIETGARVGEPFGVETTQSVDFTEGNQIVSPNENKRRATALKDAANKPPTVGNAFIVTHKPNIVDAFGTTAYPLLDIGEGEMLVFKTSPTGPILFGRLKVADLAGMVGPK